MKVKFRNQTATWMIAFISQRKTQNQEKDFGLFELQRGKHPPCSSVPEQVLLTLINRVKREESMKGRAEFLYQHHLLKMSHY